MRERIKGIRNAIKDTIRDGLKRHSAKLYFNAVCMCLVPLLLVILPTPPVDSALSIAYIYAMAFAWTSLNIAEHNRALALGNVVALLFEIAICLFLHYVVMFKCIGYALLFLNVCWVLITGRALIGPRR